MRRRLIFALCLITVGTVCAFLFRHWLPTLASAEGVFVDRQLSLTLLVLGTLFVAAQFLIAIVIAGRRDAGTSHDSSRDSAKLGWAWVSIIVGIFAVIEFTGARALKTTRTLAEREPIQLEVTGMQFQWYFRYPGADGAFGTTKPELVDASVGNPLGLDPADPDSKDDIVSTYAIVPIGHTIDVNLHAQDVIHSLFVPAFRIKQDAVPGMNTQVRFTPTQTGNYEVACAELCGIGHFRMNTRIKVVDEAEYAHWLAQHTRTQ
jgi:cytochrome c oxidase subunit II